MGGEVDAAAVGEGARCLVSGRRVSVVGDGNSGLAWVESGLHCGNGDPVGLALLWSRVRVLAVTCIWYCVTGGPSGTLPWRRRKGRYDWCSGGWVSWYGMFLGSVWWSEPERGEWSCPGLWWREGSGVSFVSETCVVGGRFGLSSANVFLARGCVDGHPDGL